MLILPYYNPIPTLVYPKFCRVASTGKACGFFGSAKYLHLNDVASLLLPS